jgi:ATP-dependent RNA helicase DDX60
MSFVPAPQQANAAGAKNAPNQLSSTNNGAADAATETTDKDLLFKLRTFDVFWVEKSALMYRDGYDKVRISDVKSLTRIGVRVVRCT